MGTSLSTLENWHAYRDYSPHSLSPFLVETRYRAELAKERANLLAIQAQQLRTTRKLIRGIAFRERAFHRLPSKLINSRFKLQVAIQEERNRYRSPKERLKEAIFLEALTAKKLTLQELIALAHR